MDDSSPSHVLVLQPTDAYNAAAPRVVLPSAGEAIMTAFRPAPLEPIWPLRLQEVCWELQSRLDSKSRGRTREEAWLLLNTALRRYLRIHAGHLGKISREDVEDISANKTL